MVSSWLHDHLITVVYVGICSLVAAATHLLT